MSLLPFEQVVAEHGPAILRVCRAVAGPGEAEDVWSETFLAALRAYGSLRPGSRVEAWLVTIAHRKAIDHRRAAARRPVPTDPLPEPLTPTQGTATRVRGLWRALEALPPKQRQAVAYHYLAGLSHRDVARIIGGGEAAARRAAADGITSLRRALRSVPAAAAAAERVDRSRGAARAAKPRPAGLKPLLKGTLR